MLEPHGLVMVLEPLNWYADHGGVLLRYADQAYAICKAVDSPSCKILFDIYHQQITEGNLIPNIDLAWDEIAYFQAGDNPGRKEPGTGEINYKNVFKHLHDKGFKGVVGMEHGLSMPGKEGELALIRGLSGHEPGGGGLDAVSKLVARDIRVDLAGPGVDAAVEVLDLGEALSGEPAGGDHRPHAVVAVDDQGAVAGGCPDSVDFVGDLSQGDVLVRTVA